MISKNGEKYITCRLGKLITCTACHIFYWDDNAKQFALSNFYNYLLWYGAYILGFIYSFLVTVIYGVYDTDVPDEVEKSEYDKTIKDVHTFVGISISVTVTMTMVVVSQMKNTKYEMVQSINGLFAFNNAMKCKHLTHLDSILCKLFKKF